MNNKYYKVKDLPNHILLENVLVKMPKDVFEEFKYTGLPTDKVIIANRFSSPLGYWVKTKDTGNRVFPISGRDIREVLDWEVIS